MPIQSDIGPGSDVTPRPGPEVPNQQTGNNLGMSKSLAHLVDAIVSKTYHNLTVLGQSDLTVDLN